MAAALLAACASPVEGTATRRQSAGLARVLPTPEQVSMAVGNRLDPAGPVALGSIDLLPRGIGEGGQVDPAECLGAATPLMRAVYRKGDVTGVGLRDFARFGAGLTVSSAHTGVVRLGSDAEAARMFAAFVDQWRACDGTPVRVRVTANSELVWTVTDVLLSDGVLSATVLNGEADAEPGFVTEHAIGVAADCIVDVDVAVTGAQASGLVAAGRAVALVRTMLRNVDAAG